MKKKNRLKRIKMLKDEAEENINTLKYRNINTVNSLNLND